MDSRRTASGGSQMTTLSSGETIYDVSDTSQSSKLAAAIAGTRWSEKSRVWIPSPNTKRSRTVVLCFDGTGDEFDSDNSNVVQLVSMLKKDDTTKQLVYYQTGIGTYTDTAFKAPFMSGISEVLDEMFAWNLSSHIKSGYSFLMENYTDGDKICIFGFSRGAYTARALAGMLQKIGLLPPHNTQQIPFAYDMYKREDLEGLQLSEMFKRTFCRDVAVEFLGVWDTVASVGLVPKYLPFVTENTGIKHLRHALALDERRIKFLPSYCVDPKRKERPRIAPTSETAGAQTHEYEHNHSKTNGKKVSSPQKEYQDAVNAEIEHETDVLEVWFAGVHTDVGGGSVKNNTRHALARIPLRWMVRQCFECKTGMLFDAVMLQQIGMSVYLNEHRQPMLGSQPERSIADPTKVMEENSPPGSFAWAAVKSVWHAITYPVSYVRDVAVQASTHTKHAHLRSQRHTLPVRKKGELYRLIPFTAKEAAEHEAYEEMMDAMGRLYDQLVANWVWNILEWVPMRVKKQKAIVKMEEGASAYTWVWNRGRGRKIFKDEMDEGLKVHRSVKTRIEAGDIFEGREKLYWPKVRPHLPQRDACVPKGQKGPLRLPRHEWDVETPEHWEWVN